MATVVHHEDSLISTLDSITLGYDSNLPAGTKYNGYRKRLFEDLNHDNNQITFAGSHSDGDFPSSYPTPYNEGESSAKIDKISTNFDKSAGQRPNIVLLHAGTNNMGSDAEQQAAKGLLGDLVDKIANRLPDAVVMVARIIHRTPATNAPTPTLNYNNDILDIVQSRASSGKKVFLVDQYTSIVVSDLSDGLHPTPAGYTKMADVWNLALMQMNAVHPSWITDPVPGDSPSGGGLTRQPCTGKLFWYPLSGDLANGAGLGKDFYPGQTCDPKSVYSSPSAKYPAAFNANNRQSRQHRRPEFMYLHAHQRYSLLS